MKKYAYVSVFALFVLFVQLVMGVSAERKGCFAIVTHKEDGVPDKVLYLPLSALQAHLDHGDKHEGFAGECGTATPEGTEEASPVEQTVESPTSTPTPTPTAIPTQAATSVSVTSVPVIAPTETPTATPTNVPVDAPGECGVDRECNTCEFLMQALDEGMVVVISGPGDVQVILDEPVPQVQVSGDLQSTGTIRNTR